MEDFNLSQYLPIPHPIHYEEESNKNFSYLKKKSLNYNKIFRDKNTISNIILSITKEIANA